ncbi:hypothetical protein P4641_07325 [Halalkalibacterium halodurans]|uniref:hypothetical protein n=1 Tax=Halalkalibacterium halodurans TaxID=86665 RepID=UPI002E227DC3|nr:hypothetical protein [Halalkalibacterium halodurans]
MKKIVVLMVVMMVLLIGCSNEEVTNYEYTFTGEGTYWQAEYVYEGTETREKEDGRTTYANEDSDEMRLTYKGSLDEIESIEKLEFSYVTSVGSGGGVREFDAPPNDLTFTLSGGSTGAKVKKDEIIQVVVTWDDFEESFELTNEKK